MRLVDQAKSCVKNIVALERWAKFNRHLYAVLLTPRIFFGDYMRDLSTLTVLTDSIRL